MRCRPGHSPVTSSPTDTLRFAARRAFQDDLAFLRGGIQGGPVDDVQPVGGLGIGRGVYPVEEDGVAVNGSTGRQLSCSGLDARYVSDVTGDRLREHVAGTEYLLELKASSAGGPPPPNPVKVVPLNVGVVPFATVISAPTRSLSRPLVCARRAGGQRQQDEYHGHAHDYAGDCKGRPRPPLPQASEGQVH